MTTATAQTAVKNGPSIGASHSDAAAGITKTIEMLHLKTKNKRKKERGRKKIESYTSLANRQR